MKKQWLTGILIGGAVVGALIGVDARAACRVLDSQGRAATGMRDALAVLLSRSASCPTQVLEFRSMLLAAGARLSPTMVANRGIHNPGAGSFSVFETAEGGLPAAGISLAPGQFFFGHFTAAEGDRLVLDQAPRKGALLIELIAWDPGKGFYNFYELRGDGRTGRWFYRGDSADIAADLMLLHRQPDPARPGFGQRLRCSGCHLAGGPIMKELLPPHNDWWMPERKLGFGGRRVDPALSTILGSLQSASFLAQRVLAGQLAMERSPGVAAVRARQDFQIALRPLFCPIEVNLESDPVPAEAGGDVRIPSAFLVDPRLLGGERSSRGAAVAMPRGLYAQAMRTLGLRFPETGALDADHAWLAPVKGRTDFLAVESLIRKGIIDREFAADVLAVDLVRPQFSVARCRLLRLVPNSGGAGWLPAFAAKLRSAGDSAATELANNLLDPRRDLAFHQARAGAFFQEVANRARTPQGALELVRALVNRRAEVFTSEISANPLGQILEPGFRVIFPVPPGLAP